MSIRPTRRLLIALIGLPAFFLLWLSLGPPNGSDLFTSSTPARSSGESPLPDEIFGFLHFMTSPDEAGRVLRSHSVGAEGAPDDKSVEMAWYARGSIAKAEGHMRGSRPETSEGGWEARLAVLREEYPLVVFSKSYCPYSKRAKELLEVYDLLPAPKIIEVDLRADSSEIKILLMRLTQRSTFPNIVLNGRSLGGSDDLMRLHEEGKLRDTLEQGGVEVRGTAEGVHV